MRVLFRLDGDLVAAEFTKIFVKSTIGGYQIRGVTADNAEPIVIDEFTDLNVTEQCIKNYYNCSR